MGLIDALGLDVRILIAQLVNFAVLVWVLWRFAYKPVLNLLEERRQKVEKGLEEAEAAGKRLHEAQSEGRKLIMEARKEAAAILEKAQERALVQQEEIAKRASDDIGRMMEAERKKIAAEKASVLDELKKEISGLLIAGMESFLEEKIDEKKDREAIEKVMKKIGK